MERMSPSQNRKKNEAHRARNEHTTLPAQGVPDRNDGRGSGAT